MYFTGETQLRKLVKLHIFHSANIPYWLLVCNTLKLSGHTEIKNLSYPETEVSLHPPRKNALLFVIKKINKFSSLYERKNSNKYN